MTPGSLTGPAAYTVIALASAVEGEVVYVAACVLVGLGQLSALPVFASGAIGAALGDQFFYYAGRGWLGRMSRSVRAGHRARNALLGVVRRHGALMGFACRFLPGLRIAAAVACAAGDVPPQIFTVANAVGALTWAAVVLAFVAWGGPAGLGRIGAPVWVAWALPAFIVLVAFAFVSRFRLPDSGPGLPDS